MIKTDEPHDRLCTATAPQSPTKYITKPYTPAQCTQIFQSVADSRTHLWTTQKFPYIYTYLELLYERSPAMQSVILLDQAPFIHAQRL